MLFNIDKCKVMHIGKNNLKTKYELDGANLDEVIEERDLGVIIQNDLKCSQHLEYSVQAWRPYYRKDIDLIEKVQRRATKLIPSLKSTSYQDRLTFLGKVAYCGCF